MAYGRNQMNVGSNGGVVSATASFGGDKRAESIHSRALIPQSTDGSCQTSNKIIPIVLLIPSDMYDGYDVGMPIIV